VVGKDGDSGHAVACVIANYQGAGYLADSLASLTAQELEPREIFVVDGGSTDESEEVTRRQGATFVTAENRGLAHLYNVGAALTDAEFVFVCNNDIELDAACLRRLVEVLAAEPSVFAADPAQVSWSTGELIHARTALARSGPPLGVRHAEHADSVVPTLYASAAGMLLRREHLVTLGGFDDTFFLDWEDVDLCWRAWQRGWASVFVPEAVFRHRVGGSDATPTVSLRRSVSSRYNKMRFALKCLPAGAAAAAVGWELGRSCKHPSVGVRAVGALARSLPAIVAERRRIGPSSKLYRWLRSGQVGPCPIEPIP